MLGPNRRLAERSMLIRPTTLPTKLTLARAKLTTRSPRPPDVLIPQPAPHKPLKRFAVQAIRRDDSPFERRKKIEMVSAHQMATLPRQMSLPGGSLPCGQS